MALTLLATSPGAAATVLQNPSATPASGTTETTFLLSVDYVSEPEARPALSASVEVVGLGGSPLPMSLVAGDDTNGTWQTSTMLPAGTWDLIFRADASGSDPDPAIGLVVTVVEAPTPTPAPSSSPGQGTPSPSSTPAATASPSPPTPPPTPAPTPLPPGEPATPTPTAPPASTAGPSPSGPASPPSASAAGEPSARPSGSETASPATRAPAASPSQSASTGADGSDGSGWGQAGWVVLGGVTSAAGAAVLLRQWLASRRTTPGIG